LVVLLTIKYFQQRKEKVTKRKENQLHTHYVKELLTYFVNKVVNLNGVEGYFLNLMTLHLLQVGKYNISNRRVKNKMYFPFQPGFQPITRHGVFQ
jgi:hypothetical protein